MARFIRSKCSGCREDVDLEPTEFLITEPVLIDDYGELEHGIYMFTCNLCGFVNTKATTPKIEGLLRTGGVMTVEELEQWLVDELTGET